MSLPKFNPWSVLPHSQMRAFRAYCAYPTLPLGTKSTISTGADTRDLKSESTRFEELLAAVAKSDMAGEPYEPSTQGHIEQALEFCRGPWLPKLVALGWSARDIFAYDPTNHFGGGLIQALDGNRIVAATAAAAYLECGTGARATYHRRSVERRDPVLAWDDCKQHGDRHGY